MEAERAIRELSGEESPRRGFGPPEVVATAEEKADLAEEKVAEMAAAVRAISNFLRINRVSSMNKPCRFVCSLIPFWGAGSFRTHQGRTAENPVRPIMRFSAVISPSIRGRT